MTIPTLSILILALAAISCAAPLSLHPSGLFEAARRVHEVAVEAKVLHPKTRIDPNLRWPRLYTDPRFTNDEHDVSDAGLSRRVGKTRKLKRQISERSLVKDEIHHDLPVRSSSHLLRATRPGRRLRRHYHHNQKCRTRSSSTSSNTSDGVVITVTLQPSQTFTEPPETTTLDASAASVLISSLTAGGSFSVAQTIVNDKTVPESATETATVATDTNRGLANGAAGSSDSIITLTAPTTSTASFTHSDASESGVRKDAYYTDLTYCSYE